MYHSLEGSCLLTKRQEELAKGIRESIQHGVDSHVAALSYELYRELSQNNDEPPLAKMIGGAIGPERVGDNDLEKLNIDFFLKVKRVEALLGWTLKSLPVIKLLKTTGSLPTEYKGDLLEFVFQKFEEYRSNIMTFPVGSVLKQGDIETVTDVCKYIESSIEQYFKGYPSRAYTEIEQCMSRIDEHVKDLFITMEKSRPELYKMRIGSNHRFSRDEMFHIPFELRGLVKSNRYSIPGLPCVYLGSSPLICWEELDRPDLDTTQTSLFLIKDDMTVLDLSLPPATLIKHIYLKFRFYEGENGMEANVYKTLRSYILTWPLIAACSIRVQHHDRPFKPEYIVPQLLLQWIRTSKYDGICYFSTRIDDYDMHNISIYRNYAFPVKSCESLGYCKQLQQKFSFITSAAPWQLFKIYHGTPKTLSAENRAYVEVEFIKNAKTQYSDTDFGRMETFLNRMMSENDRII